MNVLNFEGFWCPEKIRNSSVNFNFTGLLFMGLYYPEGLWY